MHEALRAALSSRDLSTANRRHGIKALLREHLLDPDVSERALFEAAYDDASGKEYWDSWLTREHDHIFVLVDLLAIHNAKERLLIAGRQTLSNAFRENVFHDQIYRAMTDAAKRGESWLYGDVTPLLEEKYHPKTVFSIVKQGTERVVPLEVARRSAVEWLCQDPNYKELVPQSAQAALRIDAAHAPPRFVPIAHNDTTRDQPVRRGRPEDTGYGPLDRALFPLIDDLLATGKANTAYGATQHILEKIKGSGGDKSRRLRVSNLYKSERKKPS
ncbi:hypothetical protein FF100_22405 [Methylobacterium terricola]|uniref:Uncharacterized protein n=1 Tax=Methylobacterium terricola TaxID=2583531 RepID=A0A5C4LD19_9HYPH|nr:hypothetical protein [Methylobacterium terricola]TNC10427.1 hypothetical protein FF100_22405 [Methylobacterium terricola]